MSQDQAHGAELNRDDRRCAAAYGVILTLASVTPGVETIKFSNDDLYSRILPSITGFNQTSVTITHLFSVKDRLSLRRTDAHYPQVGVYFDR